MPRANWGVSSREMDDFDREKQFKPYTGPVPPLAVYCWRIKVLRYFPATKDKHPQLRIGLELYPRNKNEKRYAGYFLMDFAPVAPKSQFRYVPFLDAIGVSTREFETRTIVDTEGNIQKIGKWRNDGDALILAQVKEGQDEKGQARREIGWYGALEEEPEEEEEYEDDEALDEDDEGEYGDEDDEEEYEYEYE